MLKLIIFCLLVSGCAIPFGEPSVAELDVEDTTVDVAPAGDATAAPDTRVGVIVADTISDEADESCASTNDTAVLDATPEVISEDSSSIDIPPELEVLECDVTHELECGGSCMTRSGVGCKPGQVCYNCCLDLSTCSYRCLDNEGGSCYD